MLYAVIAFDQDRELPQVVVDKSKAFLTVYAPPVWFVDFEGTSDDLSDLIWPDDNDPGDFGRGIILSASDRSGFASTRLWDWLKDHKHD